MPDNYFITGTDTDAGKTLVTEAFLIKADKAGYKTTAMKPLAAGAEKNADGMYGNADACKLQKAATEYLSYDQVNPLLLDLAIAPHIAADKAGRRLFAKTLAGFIRGFLLQPADIRLIEGAGGWYVPLNKRETVADVIKIVKLDVIVVIGLKLGCLNHALLTVKSIVEDGLNVAGWVGTQIDRDMLCFDENVETLKQFFSAPCLGIIPYKKGITAIEAAEYIQLPNVLR